MFEPVLRCTMPDNHHPLPIILFEEVPKKIAHPLSRLNITFTMRKWLINMTEFSRIHFTAWMLRQIAIIALTQTSVFENRYSSSLKGYFSCPV